MESRSIVLGAGCFWCTEAVFGMFDWVISVRPGYAGGFTENPTYGDVCRGKTGHAEVALLDYDADKADLNSVLDIFFAMHDPTSVNRQGNDIGSQYRSIILYTDDTDKDIIEAHIKRLQYGIRGRITTEVKKLERFYEAEDYHHDYYKKNKANPYCMFVVRPKLIKIMKEFGIEKGGDRKKRIG